MRRERNLVFLDSRDLINCVEKLVPFGAPRLAREMNKTQASIVLTFTTVIESVPRTADERYVVEFFRRLEKVPHVFVPHTEIGRFEFEEAVAAFNEERSPQHVLPTFSTWARYASEIGAPVPPPPDVLERLDAVPLAEHVRAWLKDETLLQFDDRHRQGIADTVAQNRQVLGAKRAGKAELLSVVEDQLRLLHLQVNDTQRFGEWLHGNGSVCPGWRLMQETFQEFRCDVGAGVGKGDLPDISHLYVVPYMKAATLDRKWREYVGRALRRLAKSNVSINVRLFSDLGELHSRWQRPN